MRQAGVKLAGGVLDVDAHQFLFGRDVEELLAVAPPSRIRAAARGNLQLTARFWKTLEIDFGWTRFIRSVSDPAAVGRKSSLHLIERALKKGLGRVVAGCGDEPEVLAGFNRRGFVKHELVITRPVRRTF